MTQLPLEYRQATQLGVSFPKRQIELIVIPYETETQFVSGLGHLFEAVVGLAVLSPYLRRHARRDWLRAHNVTLAYWTFQISVLTPPWFSFQGQRELVTTCALLVLLASATINLMLWHGSSRER